MRIFRYWVRDFRKETKQSQTVEGWVFGGSNVSEQDAMADLNERWKGVCRRVFEGFRKPDESGAGVGRLSERRYATRFRWDGIPWVETHGYHRMSLRDKNGSGPTSRGLATRDLPSSRCGVGSRGATR